MTSIELLFSEDIDRTEPITFEEFEHAGWTTREYLRYLQLCEATRSTFICLSTLDEFSEPAKKSIEPLRVDTLKSKLQRFALKNLSEYLTPYFSFPISLRSHWIPTAWNMTYCPFIYIRPLEDEEFYAHCIFMSSKDFRRTIEQLIKVHILYGTDYFTQYFGKKYFNFSGNLVATSEKDWSISQLEQELAYCESQVRNDIAQDFPSTLNSYESLENWAISFEHSNLIGDDYPTHIATLKEELNSRFIPKRDTVYVYSGTPICINEHTVTAASAITHDLNNNEVILNVNYCSTCHKFFIKHSEYERYIELYKFLPIRFVKINTDNPASFYTRAEASPLKLCGYSVSSAQHLSQSEREFILETVLKDEIMTKPEIMDLLDMLIQTNGLQPRFDNAKQKWLSDLRFVRDYNLAKQPHTTVDTFKSATNKLLKL